MKSFSRLSTPLFTALAFTIGFLAPLGAGAQQDPNSTSTAADGVGVARISLIEGNVAVQRGDSTDSLSAAPNAPILGGDYVTSGDGSRAEIQLDGYSQVRLGQDVQMRFTHLDAGNRSIQLAAGTLDVRLLHGSDGSTAIDTPSITVKPRQGGSYRVSVTTDGQTLVTVRSGDAQIDTPQGEQDLQAGSTLVAQGTAANPTIQIDPAIAYDDFDRFNADRDRAHAPAIGDAAFVNPEIGGVEDLAANGRWVTDGSYGHVWVPASVGPQWAPYRDGRWVWEEGYGWTWIAAEPWGWAPYHYGSWYNSPNYGWCWYPPQPRVYVPWRPALVAFIGFGGGGSGFSLGFGGGNAFANIGWVPLAPFEPYHPWWGNRYGYRGGNVNNITNISNVTNITNVTNVNVYKNVQYNAVSSVSSQRFLQGNFSHNSFVTAPQLRTAQVFGGALPVVPTSSNLRFTHANTISPVAVRSELMQRSFAGHSVAVERTPFTAQRVALAAATHAAITPLHFRDAQTTPLVVDRAHIGAAGPPQQREALGTATRQSPIPASGFAHAGVQGEAKHLNAAVSPTSAWSRFNQTRSPDSVKRITDPTDRKSTRVAPETPETFHEQQSTPRIPLNVERPPARAYENAPPLSRSTARFPTPVHQYRTPDHQNTYHAPTIIDGAVTRQAGGAYAPHPSHRIVPSVPLRNIEGQRYRTNLNPATPIHAPHATAIHAPHVTAIHEHVTPSALHIHSEKEATTHVNHEPPQRNFRHS